MQIDLEWKSEEYSTVENCQVLLGETIEVSSVIVSEGRRIEYALGLTNSWQIEHAKIEIRLGDEEDLKHLHYIAGNWTINGLLQPHLAHCNFIDISLTPLTNTLPINKLNLQKSQSETIQVLYVDILGNEIIAKQQRYTFISAGEFKYENIPNDFEAFISVDEFGFVIEYPLLFKRTNKTITGYI